jgi:hypothetical protein
MGASFDPRQLAEVAEEMGLSLTDVDVQSSSANVRSLQLFSVRIPRIA